METPLKEIPLNEIIPTGRMANRIFSANMVRKVPHKEIALKVGRVVGSVYSTTFETQKVAVLRVNAITEEHAKLSSISHPNVISLLGYTHPSKFFYLIFPYFSDGLVPQKLFSPDYTFENRMTWAQKVCDGLIALHSAGLLHLNLNLGSVAFNQEGGVVITDLECLTPEDRTDTVKSLPFIAPEILKDEMPRKRSDIYSFGVLLFCLAEQKRPFEGLTLKTMLHAITVGNKRETLSSKTPPKVAHLIKQCWKPDPFSRPRSMKEVSDELKLALKPF